jgi:hypothetical protein
MYEELAGLVTYDQRMAAVVRRGGCRLPHQGLSEDSSRG